MLRETSTPLWDTVTRPDQSTDKLRNAIVGSVTKVLSIPGGDVIDWDRLEQMYPDQREQVLNLALLIEDNDHYPLDQHLDGNPNVRVILDEIHAVLNGVEGRTVADVWDGDTQQKINWKTRLENGIRLMKSHCPDLSIDRVNQLDPDLKSRMIAYLMQIDENSWENAPERMNEVRADMLAITTDRSAAIERLSGVGSVREI